MSDTFVPITRVRITPEPSNDHRKIEKNDRDVSCPVYMVPLFKHAWGMRAKVVELKITERNMFWRVPMLPGMSAAESEIQRLHRYFKDKGKTFNAVYREHEFTEIFNKVAVPVNPYEVEVEKNLEAARQMATEMSAKALLNAAASAGMQAESRKRRKELVPA